VKTQHTPLKLAFRRPWPGTLRGLILWFFGLAFTIVGALNYIGTTIPEPTRTYLSFALNLAPAPVYGCMFVAVGLLSCLSSYCHFDRDRWGYNLAATFSGVWGLVYVCGWLFYDAPARSLAGSVVWLLYAAILTTCARIPKIVFKFDRED
jgi:hypothetical protein